MANPLLHGDGVTSGQGENSSNPGALNNPHHAQQQAYQQANWAQTQAEKRAAEAAFQAASHHPPQKLMSNQLAPGDFPIPFTVRSAPATTVKRVGGKAGRGK